jgi:Predicted transcriptional regulator
MESKILLITEKTEQIKDLRKFFNLSQERFAHVIGYTSRSVAGWENGAPISRHAVRAIQNLRSIKERLEALFEGKEIKRWLHTPNSMFNGKTPIDMMTRGETDRILQALIRLEEGIHN